MGGKQRPPTCTLIAKTIVSNREFLNKTRHWRFYKLGIHSVPQEPDLKCLTRSFALYRHLLAILGMPTPKSHNGLMQASTGLCVTPSPEPYQNPSKSYWCAKLDQDQGTSQHTQRWALEQETYIY